MLTSRVATLCDFANVREGLLNIVGGGIARVYRPALPSPLGVMLALQFEMQPADVGVPHELSIVISDPNGAELGRFAGALQSGSAVAEPEENLLVPLCLAVPVEANTYGCHSINIEIDGLPAALDPLRVWVVPMPE